MSVHLYTLCWNEAEMLPFFFRHYDPWVDRYVIYDDDSIDGSLDLLRVHPKVEIRKFRRVVPDSFVLSHQVMQNEAWKESRDEADWVVVTAIDEHLEPVGGKDMPSFLQKCKTDGVTVIPTSGYQMVDRRRPEPDWRLASFMTKGMRFPIMDKVSIFDPTMLRTPGFGVGRHQARPEGHIVYSDPAEVMLLHYKYIGFLNSYRRQKALSSGLGEIDRKNGWGSQYLGGIFRHLKMWRRFERYAINVKQMHQQ
jgi:hypothetical protein